MNESRPTSTEVDLEALRALKADASKLERINTLLDRFNFFEAIGYIYDEMMHSRFLAFLLDPHQKHKLGNAFLSSFLRRGLELESTDRVSLSQAFDSVDDRDLDRTTVHTEVHTNDGRIDILLLNNIRGWAVIIENKVLSNEHSDQLARYHRFVKKKYSGWDVFGIYLTRFGDTPSHAAYAPLNYAAVCDLLDDILNDQDRTLNANVRMAIEQYTGMVRKHIVGDSDAAKLAQEIYQKHQQAVNFIYEHRPDPQGATRDFLLRLIGSAEDLIYKKSTAGGSYLYFCPKEWEVSDGFIGFVFHNHTDQLALFLEINWGDERLRRRLFEIAERDQSPFNHLVENTRKGTNPKLYQRSFLTPRSYEDYSEQEREREIYRQWTKFLEDLDRMKATLREETWIWESDEGHSGSEERFVWGEDDIRITKRPEHED